MVDFYGLFTFTGYLIVTVLLSKWLAWPSWAVAGLNFSRNLAPTFLHNPVHIMTEISLPNAAMHAQVLTPFQESIPKRGSD